MRRRISIPQSIRQLFDLTLGNINECRQYTPLEWAMWRVAINVYTFNLVLWSARIVLFPLYVVSMPVVFMLALFEELDHLYNNMLDPYDRLQALESDEKYANDPIILRAKAEHDALDERIGPPGTV